MAAMRRALVVGVDNYPIDPLSGCVDDATQFADLIGTNADGSPNFSCRLVTDPPGIVTQRSLRAAIDQLFAQPADVALFYFSGHGTENNLGGYLVTPDAQRYSEGVSMVDVLTLANQAHIDEVILILDCCNSGRLGEIPAIANESAVLRLGVSVLSASRAGESAMEGTAGGVFTNLVCDALRGGAADVVGEITAASVYAYVDQALGAWDQRPLFKSHVSTMTTLRLSAPSVSIGELRELPRLFPTADHDLRLDPSYEPTVEPRHPEHEATFARLQRYRAARLVEVVGGEHLYFAAVNSSSCRLTPLGRLYWRRAQARQI